MMSLTLQRLCKRKWVAVLPLFVLYALLPGITIMFFYHYQDDYDKFLQVVIPQLHVWIPMMGAWWIIVLFHDFVDCEGNELLYLFHGTDYFLKTVVLVVVMYSMFGAPLCLFYEIKYETGMFLLLQLFLETVAIISFAFFLCFLLQNTGACFLIIVAYCLYMLLFDTTGILEFLSIFSKDANISTSNIIRLRNTGIVTGVFFCSGLVCSRIRCSYK